MSTCVAASQFDGRRELLGWCSFLLIAGITSVIGEWWHSGDRLAPWWIPFQIFAGGGMSVLFALIMALVLDDSRSWKISGGRDFGAVILIGGLIAYVALLYVSFKAPSLLPSDERLHYYLCMSLITCALVGPPLIGNALDKRSVQT